MASEKPFLPYGRQAIEEADVQAVARVLRSDWLTTGPAVADFEEAFTSAVGSRHAAACSSGTAALHLAALAAGIGEGDIAIVPTLTFLATASCNRYVGAEVVFADVSPDTGLMDAAHLEEALKRAKGKRVKAVYPVHLNGQCSAPEAMAQAAKQHGLTVIEDACHALGTKWRDRGGQTRRIGDCSHSDMAVFSFHPVKAIACGEGGAVTTNDAELADRVRRLRSHGMTREAGDFVSRNLAFDDSGDPNPWYYEMSEPGYNYRLSDINAALARSQLARLDGFARTRQALAERYDELLRPLAPVLRPVRRADGCDPVLHLYVVRIDFKAAGTTRAKLMKRLRQAGIGTQVHYLPVHMQPYYRDRYGEIDLPGARSYYDSCLSLPLFAGMTGKDVERVAAEICKCLG